LFITHTTIEHRVPDVRVLLDQMLAGDHLGPALMSTTNGLVWSPVLAAPDSEPRVKAVVALAPGGASHRKSGTLPLSLNFDWSGAVATPLLAAEDDVFLPLQGMW
jgi:hypothetical protein